MVNEEVITALKNAVNKGETLELAVHVLINSGYNSEEVQEASHFISRGVANILQIKPEEHLTMPQQKSGFFGKKISLPMSSQSVPVQKTQSNFPQQTSFQYQNVQPMQYNQQSLQPIASDLNYSVQKADFSPIQNSNQQKIFQQSTKEIKPGKGSYLLEILLFLILLILLGALTVSILYKDDILAVLSGLSSG